MPTQLIPQHHL
uniref:Uncharacterized protein n=1 Tax=Romanomermis culicivorax TaxID=13658 RepID=A0A915K257_ROMCU